MDRSRLHGDEGSITAAETFYAPAALVAKEMAKHWYLYLGVNIQPGLGTPPNPATIRLTPPGKHVAPALRGNGLPGGGGTAS